MAAYISNCIEVRLAGRSDGNLLAQGQESTLSEVHLNVAKGSVLGFFQMG